MGIKYSVDEDFFKNWDSTTAYVLGFIFADGNVCISNRGKYLVVSSVDREIIFKIKNWLKSEHKICSKKPNWPNGKTKFVLRIGNRFIYDSLMLRGLYPNKSLTIDFPIVPKRYLKDFIRGYFDGDGCVYVEKSKGQGERFIVKRLTIVFTSGSKLFLIGLLEALRSNLVIRQSKIYKSNRSFQIRFSTSDSIALFKYLYGNLESEIFLRRKFDIFSYYFRLRFTRVDNYIGDILRCFCKVPYPSG